MQKQWLFEKCPWAPAPCLTNVWHISNFPVLAARSKGGMLPFCVLAANIAPRPSLDRSMSTNSMYFSSCLNFTPWKASVWSGNHPGGVIVSFLDGSTRFIADGVNAAVYSAWGSRNGGEATTNE